MIISTTTAPNYVYKVALRLDGSLNEDNRVYVSEAEAHARAAEMTGQYMNAVANGLVAPASCVEEQVLSLEFYPPATS